MITDQTHLSVYKRLMADLRNVLVVRYEAPYFSEALGFSLSSLLVIWPGRHDIEFTGLAGFNYY